MFIWKNNYHAKKDIIDGKYIVQVSNTSRNSEENITSTKVGRKCFKKESESELGLMDDPISTGKGLHSKEHSGGSGISEQASLDKRRLQVIGRAPSS